MTVEPLTPESVCDRILCIVAQALEQRMAGTPPVSRRVEHMYVAAGLVPVDWPDGQLTCAPEQAYNSDPFPLVVDITKGHQWDGTIALPVVVSLFRCIPSLNDDGDPPADAELAAAFRLILGDSATIYNTMKRGLPDAWEQANLTMTWIAPAGGTVGVECRVVIGLDAELFCDGC